MKVSPDLLRKIKDAVNLVEIVGEHVVLRKAGSNYTGLCPFHSERSPSFSVSEQKQLYHCYGCKKGGDLVAFTQEIHGISFPEAVEELAERARISLPRDFHGGASSDDPEVQRKRNEAREKSHKLAKLNLFAKAFYSQQLRQNPLTEKYFDQRGVQGEVARSFFVGAAPASWDALTRHLIATQAPLDLAVELGLIRPSTKQSPGLPGYFDLFRNRAMFPIIDMRGKVAGFGGRKLPVPEGAPDLEAEGPKYMNSPESPLFQKSKLAFGLFQAQKHVREKDEIILVEGYFDVIALHAAGFQNAVATCGTSLTPDHLTLFKRFAKKIVVLFDGDRAGITATERAMETGLDQGQVLYGASIPGGLDPDEVLFDQDTGLPKPEGKAQMAGILAAAQPLLHTRIVEESALAQTGPEAKSQALKKVGAWLARYKDQVGQEVWMIEAEKKLGVTRTLLQQAMGVKPSALPVGRPVAPRPMARPVPAARPSGRNGRAPVLGPTDRLLLRGIARGGEFIEILLAARAKLPETSTLADLFDYPAARESLANLMKEPEVLDRVLRSADLLLDQVSDPQVRSILLEAALEGDRNPLAPEDFRISIEKGLGRVWARFSQKLRARLAQLESGSEANQDAGLHSDLMKEYLDVQRKIKEFNRFYDEV